MTKCELDHCQLQAWTTRTRARPSAVGGGAFAVERSRARGVWAGLKAPGTTTHTHAGVEDHLLGTVETGRGCDRGARAVDRGRERAQAEAVEIV
jgi:hypothetical protein